MGRETKGIKRKCMEKLIQWKEWESDRMPLIVNGARQVGKTYLIRKFGERHFKNVVYINLELDQTAASFFQEDLSPERLIRYLETSFREKIIPGQTLIILDEIQSCERALTSLKYFCEQAPEYHIVAAGSLLGVAIHREKYSFPVGKVRTITLNPLDFEEFLWAMDEEALAMDIREHFVKDQPLPEHLHHRALDYYKQYLMVGGMPGVVKKYRETGRIMEAQEIQNQILNDYIADMAKYSTNTESVKIRAAYQSIPSQLAKENRKFQYKVIQTGGSAALFGASIEWLHFAGVVLKCQKITQGNMPIAVYEELSSFKLYMGDVGMLVMRSGIAPQVILSELEGGNLFLGAIAENYVAQALYANGYPLYYWTSKSTAEVDFVLQKGTDIIPIEVKAGTHSRSKSLSVYEKLYRPAYSIRISAKNFGFENRIKSVPLYSVFCI